LISRIRSQALVINDHLPNGPFIASSLLDDIEDSIQISKGTT